MALSAGVVVVVPFPFTDLSQTKYRPALILAGVGRGDWVAAQITSTAQGDPRAIQIARTSFREGALRHTSFVRPGKLVTLHESLITDQVGALQPRVLKSVIDAVVVLLRS